MISKKKTATKKKKTKYGDVCPRMSPSLNDERIDIVVTDARGDRGHLAKLQLVLLRVAKCYFFTQG